MSLPSHIGDSGTDLQICLDSSQLQQAFGKAKYMVGLKEALDRSEKRGFDSGSAHASSVTHW